MVAIRSVQELRRNIEAELVRLVNEFDADLGTFHLYDKSTNSFMLPIHTGLLRKDLFLRENPSITSVVGKIVRDNTPVFLSDRTAKSDFLIGSFAWAEAVHATCGLPVRAGDETIGALFVDYRKPREFDEDLRGNLVREVELFGNRLESWLGDNLWEAVRVEPTGRSLPDELQKLVESVADLISDVFVAVWLTDSIRSPQRLKLTAQHGLEVEHFASEPFIDLSAEQSSAVARSFVERRQVVDDGTADRFHGEVAGRARWRKVWAFPVCSAETQQCMGVVCLYPVGGELTSRDQHFASLFTSMVAVLWDRDYRTRALEALYRVSMELSATPSFDRDRELAQHIATRVKDILGADEVTLHQYDQERDSFLPVATHSVTAPPEAFEMLTEPRPDGESALVLRKPLVYTEDRQRDQLVPTSVAGRFRSTIGVLLRANDVVVGVAFLNYLLPQRFSATDMDLAQVFAGFAASAIYNDRQNRQERERVKELTLLNHVGQKLTEGSRLDEFQILELILEQAGTVMNTDNMYIALYDEATDTVRFGLATQHGVRLPNECFLPGSGTGWSPRPRGAGRTEWIIKHKEPLVHTTQAKAQAWYEQKDHREYLGQTFASWIGVPMLVGQQVLGVIAAYHPDADYVYDNHDLRVLTTLASQAAIALDNARFDADVRRRAKELETIRDVVTAIASEQDVAKVMLNVAQKAKEVVHADEATIYQYDDEFKEFYLQTSTMEQKHQVPNKYGTSERVIQNGDVIFAEDASNHQLLGKSSFVHEKGVKSCMAAPLKVRGEVDGEQKEEVVGILYVNFIESPHRFTDEEQRVLRLIAVQAAIGIQTTGRLFDANRRLKTVLESIKVARESESLDELLETYLGQALEAVGAPNGTLQLLDAAAEKQIVRAQRGKIIEGTLQVISADEGVTGQALKENRLVYVPDTSQDPRYLPHFEGTRSELAVPFSTPQGAFGVLNAESLAPQAFNVSSRRLLSLFAEQAAVLITERIKLEAAEKRRLDDWSAEMTRNMAHHLKNYLGSATTLLEMLRETMDLSAAEHTDLNSIDASMQRCIGITESLFKPYMAADERHYVSVHRLVQLALDRFGRANRMQIHDRISDELPEAWIESQSAIDYVYELMVNAVAANERAMRADQTRQGIIDLSAQVDDLKNIELHIANNGWIIPRDKWETIFQQFTGFSKDEAGVEHFGLGLWGARTFFRRLGGDIYVARSDNEWTVFVVRMPTRPTGEQGGGR